MIPECISMSPAFAAIWFNPALPSCFPVSSDSHHMWSETKYWMKVSDVPHSAPPFSRSAESTSRPQKESLALQAISGTCRQHEMVSEFLGWQCWHWCMTKQFEEIAWLQASSTEVRGGFTKASRSFTTAEERESFAATLNHVRLQSARIPSSASPKNEFQRYITPESQDVYRSTLGSPPKDVTVVPNPAKVETLAADKFIQRFALQVWIHSLDVSHC